MEARKVTITINVNEEGIKLKPVYEFEGDWTGNDCTRVTALLRREYGKYQSQKRKEANKPQVEEIKDGTGTEPARVGRKSGRPKRKQ